MKIIYILLSVLPIVQEAGLPVNPILIGLCALVGIGVKLFGDNSIWYNNKKKELGMAVLGESQSGKTLWYDYLCHTNYAGEQTTERDIKKITLKFGLGRTVHLKKGKDINGDKSNMYSYEQMINDNDIILFFNNVYLYIYNKEYQRDVNSRLDFIFEKSNKSSKKIYIIWSYADKLQHKKAIL